MIVTSSERERRVCDAGEINNSVAQLAALRGADGNGKMAAGRSHMAYGAKSRSPIVSAEPKKSFPA